MLIAERMVAGIGRLRDACMGGLNRTFRDAASCGETGAGGGRRRRPGEYGQYRGRPQRYGAGGSIERLNRIRRYRTRQVASFAGEAAGLGYEAMGAPGRGMFRGAAKGMGRGMRGIGRMGRAVPGGALAMGAVDLGLAMASGESFGQAAAGTIGSVLGATLGTVFGPVGTMIGGVAGGYIGDALYTATVGQSEAAKKQVEAANKQVAAATEAARLKYGDAGEKLGGIEALSQELGGGAGIRAFAAEQLKAGKLLPEQAQQYDILGRQLTQLNAATSAVTVAQGKYDTSIRLNLGNEKAAEKALKEAKAKQKTLVDSITIGWEKMSSDSRIKILNASDELALAISQGASKVKDASGQGGGRGGGGSPGSITPSTSYTPTTSPSTGGRYQGGQRSGRSSYAGSLGDAISKEMRMKPPGSDLIVANSSETVIPAAGGYGMKAFIATIGAGFLAVKKQFQVVGENVQAADQNSQKRSQQTNTKITDYHTQTQAQILKLNQNLSSLSQQVATMSTMGGMGGMGGGLFGAGMGGAGVGKVVAVGKMLQGMGLHVAENPAFGTGRVGKHAPGSYHYSGRAIDVTGSTAQLDAAYAKLKAMGGYAELLWRTAGHYDHLHVAYAFGAGTPAFFGSQRAAINWERSMVPGSVKVASVTSNSGERLSGNTYGDIVVTVNAGSTSDPDTLATIVAMKIGEAVADARASSLFV
jgi:hypothetical protein